MQKKMTINEHFADFKATILLSFISFVVSFAICYNWLFDKLSKLLIAPFLQRSDEGFIITEITSAFFIKIKLSAFFALLISLPLILIFVYRFIAPGLYKDEKRQLAPYLLTSPLLFLQGAAIAYMFVIPSAWGFFIGVANNLPQDFTVQISLKLDSYLSLAMSIILGFGVAFQLPLAILLIHKIGLLSAITLKLYRKYAVVMIFVFAAIFTPPDIISQVILALPLVLLYELSIIICSYREKNQHA